MTEKLIGETKTEPFPLPEGPAFNLVGKQVILQIESATANLESEGKFLGFTQNGVFALVKTVDGTTQAIPTGRIIFIAIAPE